jgi:hypothetical protein
MCWKGTLVMVSDGQMKRGWLIKKIPPPFPTQKAVDSKTLGASV